MATEKSVTRLNKIVSIVKEHNGASIKRLSEELGVTEMTVRRDLKTLSDEGSVRVIHGAAIYNKDQDESSYNVSKHETVMKSEKSRIGKYAASLVKENDIILVDYGTTAAQLVENLPDQMDISITTFSANSFLAARKKGIHRIFLGGGFYHPDTEAFEGREMLDMVAQMRATKAFIVPNAVSKDFGFMCVRKNEMELKKKFVENSVEKIVLCDSSKFGKVSPCFFASFDEIDLIITDTSLPEDWQDFLKEKGIKFVMV